MSNTPKLRNEQKTYIFEGFSLEEIGKQVDSFELPEGWGVSTMMVDHDTYHHSKVSGETLSRITHWYATIIIEREYYGV